VPKNTFKLSATDPRPVVMEWSGMWKNIRISVDGELLGTIPDSAALKAGQTFAVPGGGQLDVKLVSGFQPRLELRYDGVALPGSAADPESVLKLARGVIWFMGGLTFVVGLIAELGQVQFLLGIGMNWISSLVGALMLGLGYFVGKRSMAALGVACGLVIFDSVATLVMAAQSGGRSGMGGIAMRAIFLVAMFKGFGAIKELRARTTPPPPAPYR